MASSLLKSSTTSLKKLTTILISSSSSSSLVKSPFYPCPCTPGQRTLAFFSTASPAQHEKRRAKPEQKEVEEDDIEIPTEGISRPLSEILKQLNKKVPEKLIRVRSEDGFSLSYIPWHIVNRIMNLYAPEWTGEVRSITYSPDGKSVSVVYRVTLHGTDAEISRESTGTVSIDDTGYGDPVQKAEAMAFRRACARLGLGLHLYHEDML
ncbi:hypothetical protein vseg_018825 [Gypsophila vaccaria]